MKSQKPKIAVIIVNYNNSLLTQKCLRSVIREKKRNSSFTLSIIVIDNGSSDRLPSDGGVKNSGITLIRSNKNLGFAGGNNLGIGMAMRNKADYVFLINNDAFLKTKDFFAKMLACGFDITAPLVSYRIGKQLKHDYGGKVDYLFGRNTHFLSSPKSKPDYYSGVCLLIKSSVFKKIGELDEGYFLYYEDADFCLRAQKSHLSLGFCPQAVIFHRLSSSTNKLGGKKLRILAQSHLRFCLKHLSWAFSPLYFSYNLFLRLKSLAYNQT